MTVISIQTCGKCKHGLLYPIYRHGQTIETWDDLLIHDLKCANCGEIYYRDEINEFAKSEINLPEF